MDTRRKLIILADAAKVDAARASSRTSQRDSADGQGMRSVERLLLARRGRSVRRANLDRRRVPVAKVPPFVALPDHLPKDGGSAPLRRQVRRRAEVGAAAAAARGQQTDLFA